MDSSIGTGIVDHNKIHASSQKIARSTRSTRNPASAPSERQLKRPPERLPVGYPIGTPT